MNNKSEERRMLNLYGKQKYVMHYLTLQFILEKGVIVIEYHCVMAFEEKPWMKPYIDFNNKRRAKADSEKNVLLQRLNKDLNNIMFRKSVKNQPKHVDFHVVANTKCGKKLIAIPMFKHDYQQESEAN